MTNNIRSKVVSVLGDVIGVMLNEGVEDERPYAVFDLNTSDFRTKSGVYKISGTMMLHIYTDAYDEAKDIATRAMAAIEQQMQGEEYRTRLMTSESYCSDAVWEWRLEYAVAQYNIENSNN